TPKKPLPGIHESGRSSMPVRRIYHNDALPHPDAGNTYEKLTPENVSLSTGDSVTRGGATSDNLSQLSSRPGVCARVAATRAVRRSEWWPALFRWVWATDRSFRHVSSEAPGRPATPRRRPEFGRLHPGSG